ncbi:hypothetical protein YS110_13255 [Acidovorax sp. YS12]|nr:hypothetical protein YS110_13255 [Acidovorax sp. YS12]
MKQPLPHRPPLQAAAASLCLAALACGLPPASAQTQARAQVVFAVGNSESMDGTLSGAIMTGSGMFAGNASLSSLAGSSSPPSYAVPAGFTPPKQAADGTGQAPYTVSSGGTLYDNGASRLNVAKAGIASTLNSYLGSMDFALVTYQTSNSSVYTTWAYHMSPLGGFRFTNTRQAGRRYVTNPCYAATGAAGLSTTVRGNCQSIANANLYDAAAAPGGIFANPYMEIASSADDPSINDVLYANNFAALWITYGAVTTNNGVTVTPPSANTPYTAYGLNSYNNGGILVGYASSAPAANTATGPTNAGYVPFSSQVMYVQRGFGYGGSQSATTGSTRVAMTSLGNSPAASAIATAYNQFKPLLEPETNNIGTGEIKAIAGQAATAGLVAGAGSVLSSLTATCAGQYVILLTDGLPTMSLDGKAWPPLGSEAGAGYGVYATFAGLPANAPYGMRDGMGSTLARGSLVAGATATNNQALTDTIAKITELRSRGIKTYVVGLGAGVDATQNPAANAALNAMAIAGGTGQQYPASDIPSFQAALSAIAAQIYASTQITAPVAPGSVTSGSKVYVVTSKNQSGAMGGHIEAYNTDTSPSAAPGTAVGSALWDAGSPAKMGAATRRDRLWSTLATPGGGAPGAGALAKLAGMDAAAFGWPLSPAQTCVPSLATILAYTFNPSYGTAGDTGSGGMGFPAPVAGCSYLAGREPNWMLGSMSPNDGVQYLGAPGSASLLDLPGYPAFASRNKGRQGLVLAASNDGILYGIDADTGAMHWGWMPRPFVAQLAQYTALASRQLFDGGFRVADAVDASNGWASYVVGTAQGGAYHYALQLTGNASATETTPPGPAAQAWGIGVPGGTSPQMQEPVVVTVGGRQYALFVVNTTSGATTTSALYEVNVATGQAAGGGALSASLPFAAHSAMSYDAQTGTLWLGDKTGGVWSVSITGQSTADAATALQRGAVSPAAPINFVGYGESEGIPYVWAAAKDKLTMFTLSGSGMAPAAWASQGGTSPQGYKAGNASAAVRALKQGGQISAPPVLANGVLVVPVHVPPAAGSCGAGQGYYQLFDLASGSDPKIRITYNGADVVAGEIYLGAGAPLTPGLHGSEKGIVGYPGTDAPPAAGSNPSLGSINFGGKPLSRAILWRQR